MIIQNQYYKLVTTDSCINITTYILPINTVLSYKIYSQQDINNTSPIIENTIDSMFNTLECFSTEGKYKIQISIIPKDETCYIETDETLGEIYEFQFYKKYRDEFVNISFDTICNCCKDFSLSNCDNCNEPDELKNQYSSLIYILF